MKDSIKSIKKTTIGFLAIMLLSTHCIHIYAEENVPENTNDEQTVETETDSNTEEQISEGSVTQEINEEDETEDTENSSDINADENTTEINEEDGNTTAEEISPNEDATLTTSVESITQNEESVEEEANASDFMLLAMPEEEQNNVVNISDEDRIHFLKVGSSDCILIESNGKYGLVDASNPSNSEYGFNNSIYNGSSAVSYLNFLGAKHLDFIIGTHSHSDHIGGIPEICDAVNTDGDAFIDSNTSYIFKYYENINREEDSLDWKNKNFHDSATNAMDDKNANMILTNIVKYHYGANALTPLNAQYIKNNDSVTSSIQYPFGDFTIRVYNLDNVSLDDENTNCLVTFITCRDKKVLLMADMNVRGNTEQKIIRNIVDEYGTVDLYKVGHHGYAFSTSYETMCLTDPEYVILSNFSIGNNQSLYHYYSEHNKNVYCTSDGKVALVADLTDGLNVKTYNDNNELVVDPVQWTPTEINTGWQRVAKNENQWDYIYVNEDLTVKKGWADINGYVWYYFNEDGIMARGMMEIDGVIYEFADSGELIDLSTLPAEYQKKGFFEDQGKYYFGKEDGSLAKGWLKYNNSYYFFRDNYTMVTGWYEVDSKWYFFDETGVMQTGWVTDNGKTYYLNTSGEMLKGWQLIDQKYYYFNDSGAMATGWLKVGSYWYYLNNQGVMQTGWQKIGNKYYYFKASGAMATGSITLDKVKYNFDSNGALINEKDLPLKYKAVGWENKGGKWYYIKPNHTYATGWYKVDNTWYYFNTTGIMQTGWQSISNKWYYFTGSGAMVTGWLKLGNSWYYMNSGGAMVTGWYVVNNAWYYSNKAGIMQTGWQSISNKWYYFTGSGAMVTGWLKLGNNWYYMNSGGAMVTGWYVVNNAWYYSNKAGVMQIGWQNINGKWYYFTSSGAMKTGWLKLNDNWYYFLSSGEMVTGTKEIDGIIYTFDASGKWIEE